MSGPGPHDNSPSHKRPRLLPSASQSQNLSQYPWTDANYQYATTEYSSATTIASLPAPWAHAGGPSAGGLPLQTWSGGAWNNQHQALLSTSHNHQLPLAPSYQLEPLGPSRGSLVMRSPESGTPWNGNEWPGISLPSPWAPTLPPLNPISNQFVFSYSNFNSQGVPTANINRLGGFEDAGNQEQAALQQSEVLYQPIHNPEPDHVEARTSPVEVDFVCFGMVSEDDAANQQTRTNPCSSLAFQEPAKLLLPMTSQVIV